MKPGVPWLVLWDVPLGSRTQTACINGSAQIPLESTTVGCVRFGLCPAPRRPSPPPALWPHPPNWAPATPASSFSLVCSVTSFCLSLLPSPSPPFPSQFVLPESLSLERLDLELV